MTTAQMATLPAGMAKVVKENATALVPKQNIWNHRYYYMNLCVKEIYSLGVSSIDPIYRS